MVGSFDRLLSRSKCAGWGCLAERSFVSVALPFVWVSGRLMRPRSFVGLAADERWSVKAVSIKQLAVGLYSSL